jgi:hypothetical protein
LIGCSILNKKGVTYSKLIKIYENMKFFKLKNLEETVISKFILEKITINFNWFCCRKSSLGTD